MYTSTAANSANIMSVEGSNAHELLLDIDDMLASLSPQKLSVPMSTLEQSKVAHFRVKWHAEIIIDGENAHHGFINDISTRGACVCLTQCLSSTKCTLKIHVPPLNSKGSTHFIEILGRLVYVVHDGNQQLFRAAINFLKFNFEGDLAFLGERLTKHQLKIPEFIY